MFMDTPLFHDEVGYHFRAIDLLLDLAEFVTETTTSCLQNSGYSNGNPYSGDSGYEVM
jgi:hypothetical protein